MCGMEVGTLAHIIIHCKYSKQLWKDIKEKCSSQLSLPDLTEEIVYLGWLSKGPKSQLVNFIILLYKYYLYTVRKDVSKVCLSAFKWYINYTQTIEKVIAKKNGRIEKDLSKWDPLRQLLMQLKPVGGDGQLSSSGGRGCLKRGCLLFANTYDLLNNLPATFKSNSTPLQSFGYLTYLRGLETDWCVLELARCVGVDSGHRGWQLGNFTQRFRL